MLLTKLQVNWPFGSGVKAKNKFSRWPPWRPFWISDWNNVNYFLIHKSPPMLSSKSTDLLVQEKKRKIYFKMAAAAAISDF